MTILLLMVALAQAQRQQILYIDETKSWYYVYDEQGKRIGDLSRSSVGELKGWDCDSYGTRMGRKSIQEVPIEKKLP